MDKSKIEAGQPEQIVSPANSNTCCCINWHPSVKQDQGKRAICSYCNKPRQSLNNERDDLIEEIKRRQELILSEPDGLVRETMINNLLLDV